MTGQELRDALDGLYAYDQGATGSGIHDETLRARCVEHMRAWPLGEYQLMPQAEVSRLVREMRLTEEAIGQGYGIEDAFGFTRWLCEIMGWGEL